MIDHSQYEELAALAAGGYLDDEELSSFQMHADSCARCRDAVAQFGELVHFGLPLVQSRLRQGMSMITSRPNPGATQRFIRRASAEGIQFSPDVQKPKSSHGFHLSLAAAAGVLAAVLIMFLYGGRLPGHAPLQGDKQIATQAQQQLE